MYNFRKLAAVASDGLDDMLPALRKVMSDPQSGTRLEPIFGPWPRLASVGLGLIAWGAGHWFEVAGPELPFKELISWPVVFLGLILAALLRRFLFHTRHQIDGEAEFTELAASLIPATLVVLVGVVLMGDLSIAGAPEVPASGAVGAFSGLVLSITHLLGLVAALTIAVASLCYSRAWASALFDLAVRLVVFRFLIWITSLVLLEVGIIGRLIAALVGGILDIEIPEWLPELMDTLSWAGLLSIAYLAVIGGTWTVCRDTYAELLKEGHANILERLEQLVGDKEKAGVQKSESDDGKPS